MLVDDKPMDAYAAPTVRRQNRKPMCNIANSPYCGKTHRRQPSAGHARSCSADKRHQTSSGRHPPATIQTAQLDHVANGMISPVAQLNHACPAALEHDRKPRATQDGTRWGGFSAQS
jgi:hypothetical protein